MRRVVVAAAATAAFALGVVAPAGAATSELPTKEQLKAAMLTFAQMKRLGLEPLSGPGATYSGAFDESMRFTTFDDEIDSYTFAASSSAGKHDERGIMIVVSFGQKPGAPVACRIDEGSPERSVAKNACVSERRPSSVTKPVGVSYGIKPAPGVNVIAYVSDDPEHEKPRWKVPSTTRMTAVAKRLATAQVARLRSQGLLTVGA